MADAREHRLAGPGVIAVTKQYMINVGIKPDGIIVVLLSRLFPGHVYPNTYLVHSKTVIISTHLY
jgi:hypothetical protein